MDTLQADPEFINSISQQIRPWSPRFVPEFAQAFQPKEALSLGFDRQFVEPFQAGT